jgi:NadR type nicotinamide-nucleotide adenylyltransferase
MKLPADERHERQVFSWYGGGWSEPTPLPPVPEPPDARHRTGRFADEAPADDATRRHVGVVLGRFRPPHLGHVHLVEQAFRQCGLLYVLTPPGRLPRLLAEAAFTERAHVEACLTLEVDPRVDDAAEAWARLIRQRVPNVTRLFSSDPEGAELVASALGVDHILVDPARANHPISAREIRANLYGQFRWVAPAARRLLVLNVGLVGVESAGKSTLAADLARTLGAVVVEDRLRSVVEATGRLPTARECGDVLTGLPRALPNAAFRADTGIVVVDSPAPVVVAWAERLGLTLSAHAQRAARAEDMDLFIFCEDDFGFVGPASRDEPEARARMKVALQQKLAGRTNVVTVRGDRETRLASAVAAIRAAQERRQRELAADLD